MMAAPHGPTMRKLLEWCDEASLVHWTQDEAELPSWEEAHRRLLHEGRPIEGKSSICGTYGSRDPCTIHER